MQVQLPWWQPLERWCCIFLRGWERPSRASSMWKGKIPMVQPPSYRFLLARPGFLIRYGRWEIQIPFTQVLPPHRDGRGFHGNTRRRQSRECNYDRSRADLGEEGHGPNHRLQFGKPPWWGQKRAKMEPWHYNNDGIALHSCFFMCNCVTIAFVTVTILFCYFKNDSALETWFIQFYELITSISETVLRHKYQMWLEGSRFYQPDTTKKWDRLWDEIWPCPSHLSKPYFSSLA